MNVNNERGLITVDFIFALVLIMGFASLMFALTLSLSMASVTQYVTYAAARNYVTAHVDEEAQRQRAVQKYTELLEDPAFKTLYTSGWYMVEKEPNVGNHLDVIPEFEAGTDGVNKFWGVGTTFTAAVLEFNIPFYGSTAPEGDGSGSGFQTYIGSYLGREPTTAECLEFTAARWNAIRNLPVSGGAAYSTGTGASGYYPQTDDGC